MTKEQTISYKKCPLCQSEKIEFALKPKDHTVSQTEFEVWECEDCHLRFTQHIPAESEIGKYYQSEEYISHSNTSRGLINTLYQWVRNYTLGQKQNLIEKISGRTQGNILDIGCGTGEFLGRMKAAGWSCLGLEPDEGARKQVLEKQGVEAQNTDALFQLAADNYDVITMWHVLEHVHQLHENLDQVYKILKADGTLLIAVPNYPALDGQHYQAHWAAYDVPRHLYHFCPPAMKQLLSDHRFEVRTMKHMPFDAFYVSLLSEKYKTGSSKLFSAFFTGLRSFLKSSRNAELGSSIMYIIDKKAT